MSARSFAVQLREILEDLQAKGTAAIYCDNLIAYLREVEKSPDPDPGPLEIEKYRADLQELVEARKHDHESDLEMFRSVIVAGQNAIKSSFLLNGGAAVAVLAFIGHLAQFSPERVAEFGICLLPFTYGVLAIAVTSGFTYLSQWFYGCGAKWGVRVGLFFNVFCVLLGLSSYAFFAWGLLSMHNAFQAYA